MTMVVRFASRVINVCIFELIKRFVGGSWFGFKRGDGDCVMGRHELQR